MAKFPEHWSGKLSQLLNALALGGKPLPSPIWYDFCSHEN
jgi:hypothetical protein